jgi:hypothetical protein
MSLLDTLLEAPLETTDEGRHLFRPWGDLGPAYAIEETEEYRRVRRGIRAFNLASFLAIVAAAMLLGPMGLLLVALLAGGYLAWAARYCTRLERVGGGMGLREALGAQGRRLGPVWSWTLGALALLFTAGGVVVLPSAPVLGGATVVFFGVGTSISAAMIVYGRR